MNEFEVTSDESWQAAEAILAVSGTIEESESLEIRAEIDWIVENIGDKQAWLEMGWIKLGMLVHWVREMKYWRDYGFENFPGFVEDIASKVNRKRSYIYQCKGIAEKLLPQLSAETLIDIGITKAGELKKYAVHSGKLIPDDMLEKVKSAKTKTHEVKAIVQTALNPAPEESGRWYDFGGFYLTTDERTLLEETFKLALQDSDQPVATDLPDHVQRKIVMMRLCAEYYSTYFGGTQ